MSEQYEQKHVTRSTMYNLVIVSMFKNEGMILKEWLDHHINAGVQHFYLIDNGSTDNYAAVLSPYQDTGTVTLVIDPSRYTEDQSIASAIPLYDHAKKSFVQTTNVVTNTQELLYNRHYLGLARAQATWIMVLDQDEYMFSTRGSLTDILGAVDDKCTTVWVPWRIFGSGGNIQQPSSIRKGFLYMRPFDKQRDIARSDVQGHGKSISRASSIVSLRVHLSDARDQLIQLPDGSQTIKTGLYDWMETHVPASDRDLLFCNHYATMSREYFSTYKSKRGGGVSGVERDEAYFLQYNKGCKQRDTLIELAKGVDRDPITQSDIYAANKHMERLNAKVTKGSEEPAVGQTYRTEAYERELLQRVIHSEERRRHCHGTRCNAGMITRQTPTRLSEDASCK